VVGVDEILHPGYHGRVAQPVTCGAIGVGVVLDVEHAGEGLAVPGPTPAVREKECRLCAAGTYVGVREVVPATDEACTSGTGVAAREVGVNVRGAFCGLRIAAYQLLLGGNEREEI
jgi:hypothetical protein